MKRSGVLAILLSFLVGIATGAVIPGVARRMAGRWLFPEHSHEIVRLTSPDGAVDAVM